MFKLSGFADEISSNFDEQVEVLVSEGIGYIELRSVWNKNVLDFTDEDIQKIQKILNWSGIRISSIGSPIGKVSITDSFEEHLVKFHRAVYLAHFFETPIVRIFSFYIPEGEAPSAYRDKVLFRMSEMAKIAQKEKVLLVHENERHIYGDSGARCLDILQSVGMESLMACYDPANFVVIGVEAYPNAYSLIADYVRHVHIKDAKFSTGDMIITPAGEGDGHIKEALSDIKSRGYDGYLTLEPHLTNAGKMYGFSGPEQFKKASSALKLILAELT